MTYDIIIKGGTIVDGTGAPRFDADLALANGRIAEVGRISDVVSFEPDIVSVQLDGAQRHLEPGQTVIPHGPDRDLDVPAATAKQI